MKSQYVEHDNVTRDILDTVKKGDMIKCNGWKRPMKVAGVSKNYFVMIQKMFGSTCYSVCEKKRATHSRNNYTKDSFRIGTDDYIFGFPTGYCFEDETFITEYLEEFEKGETQLSVRAAVDLKKISIKGSTNNTYPK